MITLHFVGTGESVYFAPAHITMIYSGKAYHPATPMYVTCVGLTDGSEIKVHETPEEIRDLVDAALRPPAVEQAASLLRGVADVILRSSSNYVNAFEVGQAMDKALGIGEVEWPETADALRNLADRLVYNWRSHANF